MRCRLGQGNQKPLYGRGGKNVNCFSDMALCVGYMKKIILHK
jgi:hypothetical protein